MNKQQKHTSDLVKELGHQLLKRREHLYELLDKFTDSETFELSEDIEDMKLINGINDEINRIQNIFKLIEKNKI
jgi:Mg/Co/Ni transporter MgtE